MLPVDGVTCAELAVALAPRKVRRSVPRSTLPGVMKAVLPRAAKPTAPKATWASDRSENKWSVLLVAPFWMAENIHGVTGVISPL